jgi:hypothetical protein
MIANGNNQDKKMIIQTCHWNVFLPKYVMSLMTVAETARRRVIMRPTAIGEEREIRVIGAGL